MATITVQIPDALADALTAHVDRTGATTQGIVTAAIALRLMQSSESGRVLVEAYLDAEFPDRCNSGADAV